MPKYEEKYLVTGAAGQLGYCLQNLWGGEEGHALPRAREALDISNPEHVEQWLPRLNPDAVVNCAGYTNVAKAEEERYECWQANVEGVSRLAKICSEREIALVHISSDFVFGQNHSRLAGLQAHDPSQVDAISREEQLRNICYQENDVVGPMGYYGQTKAMAEHVILQEALANPDFQYYIIRTAGLFEQPWRAARNFPYVIANRMRNSQVDTVEVVSDVYTNITYVPHLVEAIRWLVKNRNEITVTGVTIPVGIYHITNTGMASWYEVAEMIDREVGFSGKLRPVRRVEYCQKRGQDPGLSPSFTVLCNNKYDETLGPQLPSWQTAISTWATRASQHFRRR